MPAPTRSAVVELAPDTRVGRYVVHRRLGAGRAGVVYVARDPQLDREVALKILRVDGGSEDERALLRQQLLREAGAMGQLAHPNVVAVHDVGSYGDHVFVVTELVEGQTLAQWIAAARPRWREVVAAFVAAARGLEAAHAAGLVHGDFTSANVLMGSDGRVRVSDFGQSAAFAAAGPAPPDVRSDQRDFAAALGAALATLPEPAPRWVGRVLARAQAADASARWPSMGALAAALSARPERTRRWLLGGAALAAVAVALGFGWAHQRTRLLCTGSERKLAGAWDGERRHAVEAAFAKSGRPYAAATFAEVARVLDDYVRRWTAMRTEACVDTRVRRRKSEDVLERRMLCLDGRLGEVRGLTTRFAAAPDPELVERATRAVHALGDLAGCADTQALTSPVRPPADPDLRAKVAALRVELGAVKALQYAGRFREGRDQARPLAARAAALGYRPLEAEAQLLLGMLESNAGDGKAASAALDKAVWAAEAGRDDEVAARAWIQQIQVYQATQARFADALALAPRVTSTLERLGGNDELEGMLRLALGKIYLETSRYDEADRDARRALALFEKRFGPDGLRVADALDEVGDVAFHRGGYTAGPYFERELAIKLKHYGEDHPETARAIGRLASVRYFQSRFAEARELGEKTLRIDERALGSEHRLVARDLNNLSLFYTRLGQLGDAAKALERAVEIDRKVQPGTPQHALHVMNVSSLLTKLGRPAKALPYAEEALAVNQKRVGPDSEDVGSALHVKAEALHALGRDEEAREACLRNLAIFDKVFGPRYLHSYEPLLLLAEIELSLAAPVRAQAALARARGVTAEAHIDPSDRAQMDYLSARALVDQHEDRAQAQKLAQSARAVLAKDPALTKELAEIDRFLLRQGWATTTRP